MKKTKMWKRILTALCIAAMMAGIVNPSAIYAGDDAQGSVSGYTESSENTDPAASNSGQTSDAAVEETTADVETAAPVVKDIGSSVPYDGENRDTNSGQDASGTGERAKTMSVSEVSIPSGEVSGTASEGNSVSTGGIDLETNNYLQDYQISYRSGNDWKILTSDTTVPGYTSLRLTVFFGGISAQALLDQGGLLYLKVPDLLLNPTVSSGVVADSNGNQIGTITAAGDRIELQADNNYLREQIRSEGADYKIQNGQLSFSATPDPAKIRENTTQTLKLGPLEITLHFDADSDAKSGSLVLNKSTPEYIEDKGNAYLKYSLTVTTGEAPMPEVTVTDHFTANAGAVESYVGVSTDSKNLPSTENGMTPYEPYEERGSSSAGSIILSQASTSTDPGTMLWNIGNMEANTSRTLYYYVKLKPDYVGAVSSGEGTITNTATPKSRTYEHNSAASGFTPKSAATISKKSGTATENADNTVTIPYTITVTADSKNTWNLKNVKISDDFGVADTSVKDKIWDAITPTDSLKNLGFGNFKMTSGSETKAINAGTRGETEAPFYYIKKTNENPGFNFYLGDLAPGETRTVTFDVTLKPIFSSSEITIGNRASAYTNDSSSFGNKQLAFSSTKNSLGKQHWDRKIVGAAIENGITQNPGTAYTLNGSSWSSSPSAAEAVEVPTGSFQYQVVVNENGKWDVSSAAFNDKLTDGGKYLQYSGYLEVKYYKTGVDAAISSGNDASVVEALTAKTADKTLYLNIDGMKTFSLKPDLVDSSLGRGAYLLTYYAKPVSGSFSRETAGNTFSLSGNIVGTGGKTYILPAMQVEANVTVTGSQDYSVHKDGWYYDSADTSDGFTNGKLYWVITVKGTELPAGMQLYDAPQKEPNQNMDTSIAGVYFGTPAADGSSFTDNYAYYSQIKGNSSFTQVSPDSYSWALGYSYGRKTGAGTLTFNKKVEIPDGKAMYIILMTMPNSKWDGRTIKNFNNSLQERSSQSNTWQDVNTASLSALGVGTNFKEVGEYGNYDSASQSWNSYKEIMQGNNPANKILKSYTLGSGAESLKSGTYIDYRLLVNYAGDEAGSFRVEDVVPEGMEPVYVRYFWTPGNIRTLEKAPTVPEIEDLPSGDWKDIGLKNAPLDNAPDTRYNAYAYYDKSAHRILYDVGNLEKGSKDTQDLQVQIVMRVTDPETLMGKSTAYVNTMNVYRTNGTLLSTSRTNTIIDIDSISKTAGDVSLGSVPFSITVNPRGEDLLPDSDTVTLVDVLDGKMILDPSSVTVMDSSGKVPTDQWKISISRGEGSNDNTQTTMTLVIPDSRKLTISYKASIDAAPNTPVTYHNTAYWYGYQKDSAKSVSNKVQYSVDATWGKETEPYISLIKADKNNITTELPGAEFSIYLAEYDTQKSAWVPEGAALETLKTTASGTHAGILTFGADPKVKLLFNTVYCIVETKAPVGYVKDSTAIPVAIARADKNGSYPNESAEWSFTPDANLKNHTADDLNTWVNRGVNLSYKGSTFTITAYNEKTSLKIIKSFTNADGTQISAPAGTFSFGLFSANGSSTGEKLETLTMTSDGNGNISYKLTSGDLTTAVNAPVFKDLNVGDSYKVYELDADGKPVENNRIFYNKEGNGYVVKYSKNPLIVAPNSATPAEFAVGNQEFMIPTTGIRAQHSDVYKGLAAGLAVLLSGYLLLRRRKRSKRQ